MINVQYVVYSAAEAICEPLIDGAAAGVHLIDYLLTRDLNALKESSNAIKAVFYLTAYKTLITAIAILDIQAAEWLDNRINTPFYANLPSRNLSPAGEKIRVCSLWLFETVAAPQAYFRQKKHDLFDN